MKMTLSTSQAASLLAAENNGFTYSGATALCEFLEELEAGTGEAIEFDPVAIRCDFSEYRCLEYWARDYFVAHWESEIGIARDDSAEEMERKIREYIRDNGTLIEFDGGIIVSAF